MVKYYIDKMMPENKEEQKLKGNYSEKSWEEGFHNKENGPELKPSRAPNCACSSFCLWDTMEWIRLEERKERWSLLPPTVL
jgi:hypothetical protein